MRKREGARQQNNQEGCAKPVHSHSVIGARWLGGSCLPAALQGDDSSCRESSEHGPIAVWQSLRLVQTMYEPSWPS